MSESVLQVGAPRPVRTAGTLVVLVGLTYLLTPLLAAIGLTVGGVWVVSKGGEASWIASVGAGIWVFVLVVAVVFGWLAAKLRQGRGWARNAVTVLLVLGALGAAGEAWVDLTSDPVTVPIIALVRIVLIAFALVLLASAEAKAFFARTRRA